MTVTDYDAVKVRPVEVFAFYDTVTGHRMLRTARRFGLSVEKLEEFMLIFGKIPCRSRGPSVPKPLLEKKLDQGKTQRQIACELGMSKSAIGYAMNYYGLSVLSKT